MIDRDFTALQDAAMDSLAGRTVQGLAGIITASTRTSQAATWARAAVAGWQAIENSTRVQLLLLTAGSATIFYAMLLSIEPRYVASGIPALWYYVVGASLVLLSAASQPLAAALADSAIARLGRWLIR